MKRFNGSTLVELLVVAVILSILASVTLPYASMIVKRNKEVELKRALITIRLAIDQFHEDWRSEELSKFDKGVSANGYPKTLDVLVEGVAGRDGKTLYRYLRRVPTNPFVDMDDKSWRFRGYLDSPEVTIWNDQDVYDVIPLVSGTAIDGSNYDTW